MKLHRRAMAIVLIGIAIGLIGAGSASATTRYAAPGGTATAAECTTPANQCTIYEAAQGTGVMIGDEVVITPGNYSDTAGDLGPSNYVDPVANTVHGAVGEPRPVITLDTDANGGFGAFKVETGNTISHVEIDTAGSQTNIGLTGGVVEDLIARSSNTLGPIVCRFTGTATLRDSVCISSGDQGRPVGSFFGAAGTQTVTLRNVTAVATGANTQAINFAATMSGQTLNVDAKSVIASAPGMFGTDVYGQEFNGAETAITLDHSNFSGSGGQGTPTITSPFVNDNQIAEPVLASDLVHQLSNSPTINAGAVDADSGSSDIDGNARTINTADIGADEFLRTSNTSVSCLPASMTVGAGTSTCVVTVTDIAGPDSLTPTGSISSIVSTGVGNFGSGCAPLAFVSSTQANCTFTYTPTFSGTHVLTATYRGDSAHSGSQSSGILLVAEAAIPPAIAPSPLCGPLRKKLKAAKKRGDKAKVGRLRAKLRRLGC
jgi:hypothetical protein